MSVGFARAAPSPLEERFQKPKQGGKGYAEQGIWEESMVYRNRMSKVVSHSSDWAMPDYDAL